MTENQNPSTEKTKVRTRRRRDTLQRISYGVAEYARMTGRQADAVRREIERKARRAEDGSCVAELALGVRACKPVNAGRWSIVVPRNLTEGT